MLVPCGIKAEGNIPLWQLFWSHVDLLQVPLLGPVPVVGNLCSSQFSKCTQNDVTAQRLHWTVRLKNQTYITPGLLVIKHNIIYFLFQVKIIPIYGKIVAPSYSVWEEKGRNRIWKCLELDLVWRVVVVQPPQTSMNRIFWSNSVYKAKVC